MNRKLQHLAYVVACSLSLLTVSAYADDSQQATNSQQTKMKSCNADAKAKKLTGDDRKTYMKTCLSAAPAAASTGNSQQQKMKTCNADATSQKLTGNDRKAYMKTCLSAAPASAMTAPATAPATAAPASTPSPTGK